MNEVLYKRFIVSRATPNLCSILNTNYMQKYNRNIIDILDGNFADNLVIQKILFKGEDIDSISMGLKLKAWCILNYGKGENHDNIEIHQTFLQLPNPLLRNLIDYFSNELEFQIMISHHNNFGGFDCYSFIKQINGEDIRDKSKFESKKFELIESGIQEDNNHKNLLSNFKPGDTGTIAKKNSEKGTIDHKIHFALYLGEGLFISKYGQTPVYISSLEEMLREYPGDCLIRSRRKEKEG